MLNPHVQPVPGFELLQEHCHRAIKVLAAQKAPFIGKSDGQFDWLLGSQNCSDMFGCPTKNVGKCRCSTTCLHPRKPDEGW